MIYDLQKASLLKRFSAYLLDLVVLVVLITGFAFLLSGILRFNTWSGQLSDCYEKYEMEYGVKLDITQTKYDAMTPEEQAVYDAAYGALNDDPVAVKAYNMLISLTLMILSLSVLFSYLCLEFLIPIIFGNGQTIGKRIFGIGLIRSNGTRINKVSLLIRTLLGKFAIETMIPLLLVLMMFMGGIGLLGPTIVLGLLMIQMTMVLTSRQHKAIHDALAKTVAVDIASQMIFDTEEEAIAYHQRRHEEMVHNKPY